MNMDQKDLDYEYYRLIERSEQIGECRLPTKTQSVSRRKITNKEAANARKQADHDLTIRCCDGISRRAHQIVYMKMHSDGVMGTIVADGFVIRTCNTPGCISGQHLAWQSYREREELKRLHKQALKEMSAEVLDELRTKVRKEGLTDKEIIAIHDSDMSTRETAEMYGCSYVTIYRIRSGESYSHLTGAVNPKSGGEDKRIKLTDDQVREIRDMEGILSSRKLAEKFGVSHVTVRRIQNMEGRRRVD